MNGKILVMKQLIIKIVRLIKSMDILMKRKFFIINILLIKNMFFNTIQDIQVIG